MPTKSPASRPAPAAAPTGGLVLPTDPSDDAFNAALGLMGRGADAQTTADLGIPDDFDAELTRQEAELDAREARVAAIEARKAALLTREVAALQFTAPAGPLPVADLAPVGMPHTVRIVLEDNDNIPPTGLPLGHNGRTFHLKSGVEANVPVDLLGILDNAVMDVPIQSPDTLKVTGYRKRLRFPYRIVSGARFAA